MVKKKVKGQDTVFAPTAKGLVDKKEYAKSKNRARTRDHGILAGVRVWKNPRNKFTVFRLHYSADPRKDPKTEKGAKWFDVTRSSVASESAWQQEYEINFDVSTGRNVFPQFRETYHVGDGGWISGLAVLEGLDFGTHHPCWVWAQYNTMDEVFEILECALGFEIDFPTFAEHCTMLRQQMFPEARYYTYCDRQGSFRNPQGMSLDSPVQHLQKVHNIDSTWADFSAVSEGLDKMRKLMIRQPGNDKYDFRIIRTPEREIFRREPSSRIVTGTQYLIDAMAGGYHYKKSKDGSYTDKPYGGGYYEHGMDALRMIIINYYTTVVQDEERLNVPDTRNTSEWGLTW